MFLTGKTLVVAEQATRTANKVQSIELRDQYDAPQKLAFPTTNITVFTIADKKGSEQMDEWIAALKSRFAGRIDIHGLADVRGVPKFFQGRLRAKFRESRKYPVMMDWTGAVCIQLGYVAESANILILGVDGTILDRFTGAATPSTLEKASSALERALASRADP